MRAHFATLDMPTLRARERVTPSHGLWFRKTRSRRRTPELFDRQQWRTNVPGSRQRWTGRHRLDGVCPPRVFGGG